MTIVQAIKQEIAGKCRETHQQLDLFFKDPSQGLRDEVIGCMDSVMELTQTLYEEQERRSLRRLS